MCYIYIYISYPWLEGTWQRRVWNTAVALVAPTNASWKFICLKTEKAWKLEQTNKQKLPHKQHTEQIMNWNSSLLVHIQVLFLNSVSIRSKHTKGSIECYKLGPWSCFKVILVSDFVFVFNLNNYYWRLFSTAVYQNTLFLLSNIYTFRTTLPWQTASFSCTKWPPPSYNNNNGNL